MTAKDDMLTIKQEKDTLMICTLGDTLFVNECVSPVSTTARAKITFDDPVHLLNGKTHL